MLTPEEQQFIAYWEKNRDRQKRIGRQLLVGIPVGLAFSIPIFLNFTSGWYKRADMEANSYSFNPLVLLIALLLIVGFVAIFYNRHRWEMREQLYREILSRKEDSDAV